MDTKKAVIIGIIAVIAAGGYFVYRAGFLAPIPDGNNVPGNERVFCTKDALKCPDGSYVGRTGPNCQFSACPAMESFTGTLKQDSSGFALIIPSPGDDPLQVAYRMPLIVPKVSNVLGQLVNARVRAYGSFSEGNTLVIDHFEPLSGKEADATLGEARLGGTVFINGVRITVNRIVEDSRCPADVQCIWAGRLVVNVSLKSDTDKETRDLTLGAAPVGFDSWQVSLAGSKPEPVSGVSVPTKDYVFQFRVASNK